MTAHNMNTRTEAVRLYFDEHRTVPEISTALNASQCSIRSWVRRLRQDGEKGLRPRYEPCGRKPSFEAGIIRAAVEMKKAHPLWGAGFILVRLGDIHPCTVLPKARRLQQIFKSLGLQPKRAKLPRHGAEWACHPFDRVQVDAKERLRTADGQQCCYLNFTDEHTGSVLDAFVFPLCPDCRSRSGRGPRLRPEGAPKVGTHQELPLRQRPPLWRPEA